MEKVITCLTGPSLSGKTTITNMLLMYHDLILSKHITTRLPRVDDAENFYNYISLDLFTELLKSGNLLIGSTDGIRGYGVSYNDCMEAFKKSDTVLIHTSYKDIYQLKSLNIPIRLVVLTYKNLEESMAKRFALENKFRNDIEYRLQSAMEDHKKYFEDVKNFAKEVIYTDMFSKDETYEMTSKAFGYEPYTRKRVR